jgi:tripeptidyl-peptidase-1
MYLFICVCVCGRARCVCAGKGPLGFLNPALYSLASGNGGSVGFDIVAGNNKADACPQGFAATQGFDAVTGLGTPRWSVIAKLIELK